MNELHWHWHQRAALRIRATMQDHNIWDIPGSPGYQGHTSGHRRPRSQDVPEPPRQAARRNSPERPRGPPPGMGSPFGTYRSPLRPFAPRRGPRSPHASGRQGGTQEQRQETRNPGRSRRRSLTSPPAARRVVFHEGMDRRHGGPCDPHAQRTPSTTDPQRRSKRPRAKRAHIPTILTPVERQQQAALHPGPRRATDGASSSSAASLPGSAADPLSGGLLATETRPREAAADPRPAQGMAGQPPPPATPLARHRRRHRFRIRVPTTRLTGAVHHGIPNPSCNIATPPRNEGRIATMGARGERPRGRRRNDRDFRPSGVR